MHLINSIQLDPAKIGTYPELERELRAQLESSTRKFEQLKTTISNLVEYTRDIRGFVDVDLLERRADQYKPNMAVVRSLRLTKYVLSVLIYLTKGDPRFLEDMKPAGEFFDQHPQLREITRTRKDVDTVLLALYNEPPRKFIADHSPQYGIGALLEEILLAGSKHACQPDGHFFRAYGRQFEESMCALTGAVLRLLFNVEDVDTDMDIMMYFAKAKEGEPVRLKRVFPDDVKSVHQKIDHSLFLLKEAASYVLTETQKDPSFVQHVLNQSFAESVLDSCRALEKDLDAFDVHLAAMVATRADALHLGWEMREKVSPHVASLNALMESGAYRDLLLLARDMKEVGHQFFAKIQLAYGYFAQRAAEAGLGLQALLDRYQKLADAQFSSIDRYLRFVPDLEKKLSTFRKSYGQITLIEGGSSEFYRTIIHETSQVSIGFSPSVERGKRFNHRRKPLEELDLLFDPLYGDKMRNITEPIIALHDTFSAQSEFNLGRFLGSERRDADVMRRSYRKIMRVELCADAILEFYGNLLADGKYMFDCSALRDESANARAHLASIANYCRKAIGELAGGQRRSK